MTTLGAVYLPYLPPERLRSMVQAADEAGLEELWLWEDCFEQGGIASMAAALAWTERLRIGMGLLPVPLRNVALTAMEVATLDRLFPGRALVEEGRARRTEGAGDRHTVVVYVHAATGPDAAERMAAERAKWGYDSADGRFATGSAEQIAEAVRGWADAGADTVVLQPTLDDPDPEGFMRFVAQEVRPLVP